MAQPPVFRRFSISDYPTADSWVETMFSPLNVFCEQTVSNLTKNLSIGQNVQGQKFSTSFTTPSDYATGGFTKITFQYTGGGTPNCFLIGSISRTDGTAILTPVTITSAFSNINVSPLQVTINYIAGLAADTKYNITLLAL